MKSKYCCNESCYEEHKNGEAYKQICEQCQIDYKYITENEKEKKKMKKTNVNEMYGANLAKLTEDETREMIEEFRNDGYDENYIQQFLADVAVAKNSVDNNGVPLAEKFGGIDPLNPNGEDFNPLEIDRREWADGMYRARTTGAKLVTMTKRNMYGEEIEQQALRLNIKLFDDAEGRTTEITTTYYEGFFDSLFIAWEQYFRDYTPHTLGDCIKLTAKNDWYIIKKTNGNFTNYNPARQSPTAQPKNSERYVVIDLL